MPCPAYYRKQAELFASLALANSRDLDLAEGYSALALDFLSKADAAEDTDQAGQMPSPHAQRGGGSDMDRD